MKFLSSLARAAKRAKRRTLIAVALVLGGALLMGLTWALSASEPQAWPDLLAGSAEEASLAQVVDLLETPDDRRRAAVVGTNLLVATSDPEIWPAIDADDKRQAEAADAWVPSWLPIWGSEAGPATEEDAFDEVVRAVLPYPQYEMVSRLAETSAIEFRVHQTDAAPKGTADLMERIIPSLLLLGLLVWMLRSMGGSKSAWNVIRPNKLKHGFEAVAGIDTAQDEVTEVVEFLRNPEAASRLGGRMPKGMLLDGPPGAGKTLLARAMAKEAGVPFISLEAASVSGIIMGAGVRKVRKAFAEARKLAPCIIFIDEIDAMGRARGSVNGTVGDEKETTLNALLVELDGFESREGIFLIAATNRPEILDKALTRRGRIDRRITMTLPDLGAREKFLAVHLGAVRADPDLDTGAIAATTYGFSGADLAALVNEVALMATRAQREVVTQADFLHARDRLLVGLSGSQRSLTTTDRRLTAVHEAGYALVASLEPEADPIEKVTIIPQGGALGFVLQAPAEDRSFETLARLKARIKVAVAGRAAEILVLGPQAINSGASSDIEQATRVAWAMVTQFGMSDAGFVKVDPQDPHSVDTQRPVIAHVRGIIEDCRKEVEALLKAHEGALLGIAQSLEERETLTRAEVLAIVEAEASTGLRVAAE